MRESIRRRVGGATEPAAVVINLRAEINGIPGLQNRRPDTREFDLDPAFGRSFPYRDGIISTIKFSGRSAWERHAEDEIVIVAAGRGFLSVLLDDGRTEPQSLSEDILVVVPKYRWHQIESDDGISLITITPQPTDHMETDDQTE